MSYHSNLFHLINVWSKMQCMYVYCIVKMFFSFTLLTGSTNAGKMREKKKYEVGIILRFQF